MKNCPKAKIFSYRWLSQIFTFLLRNVAKAEAIISSLPKRVNSSINSSVWTSETRACFDRGLRNKLMVFAADPYIGHAFRGQREGANCFTWDDLDDCNIFLRIPAGPYQLAEILLRLGITGPQDFLKLTIIKDNPPVVGPRCTVQKGQAMSRRCC